MSIQRLHSGKRMSQIVIHGNTVYLAGQVADKMAGKSYGEQTQEILARIDQFLAEAGTDKSKLLTATIYVSDMAHFGEMNEVWDAWVAPGSAPTRATVEANLAGPEYNVEIVVSAAK